NGTNDQKYNFNQLMFKISFSGPSWVFHFPKNRNKTIRNNALNMYLHSVIGRKSDGSGPFFNENNKIMRLTVSLRTYWLQSPPYFFPNILNAFALILTVPAT